MCCSSRPVGGAGGLFSQARPGLRLPAGNLRGCRRVRSRSLRLVIRHASSRMWWSGACLQCHNVDFLCQSLKILLLFSGSNCDVNRFQFHLFCRSWQFAVWRDPCPIMVDRDIHYTLRTSAAPHCPTSTRRTKTPKGKENIEPDKMSPVPEQWSILSSTEDPTSCPGG